MRRICSGGLLVILLFCLLENVGVAQAGNGGKDQWMNPYGENTVLFAEQISVNGTELNMMLQDKPKLPTQYGYHMSSMMTEREYTKYPYPNILGLREKRHTLADILRAAGA